jgi:site-specific recombinase XerD
MRRDPLGLYHVIQRLAEQAGITERRRLSPHSIRHASLTASVAFGGSVEFARRLANHSSIKTTQAYFDGYTEQDFVTQREASSPMARLKLR